jgi:predicted secreted protein
MNPFTGVAMYIMIWWITLFAVLPFGTRPVPEADSVTGWRGVPEKPRMWRKLLITTLVAAVVWGFCYLVIRSNWLSFRSGWLALPEK